MTTTEIVVSITEIQPYKRLLHTSTVLLLFVTAVAVETPHKFPIDHRHNLWNSPRCFRPLIVILPK